MAMSLGIGIGLSFGGAAPGAAPTALLVAQFGNSRSIGRDSASGDAWAANVREWTQAGALAVPANTVLDVADTSGNTQATDLSPALPFAADVNTLAPSDYDLIVFVGEGEGSTGWSDSTWDSDGVPNRLSTLKDRWNAAHAHLTGLGYTIEPLFSFYIANPDTTSSTFAEIRNDGVEFAAYIRANCTGATSAPVIFGGGQADAEYTSTTSPNVNNNAVFATLGQMLNYGESFSIREDRYGLGGTWPLTNFDGTHLSRANTIVQGRLMYEAWQRAKLRTSWNPYSGLSFFANLDAGYDFDIGAGYDLTGNNNSLTLQGTNDPLVRYDSGLGRYVFDRPSGTGRVWKFPTSVVPPAAGSYTRVVLVKFDSLATTQALLEDQDTATTAANRTLFRHALSTTNIVAGHGTASSVNFPNSLLTVGQWAMLAVTYDAPTTTMQLTLNAAVPGSGAPTSSAVSANSAPYYGILGGASLAGATANAFTGDIALAMVFDKALSSSELAELKTVINTRFGLAL